MTDLTKCVPEPPDRVRSPAPLRREEDRGGATGSRCLHRGQIRRVHGHLDPLSRLRAHGAGQLAVAPSLLRAELLPSPDGAVDVDGPRWILKTTWLTDSPLAAGTRLEFLVDLDNGQQLHLWDIADLWWNPPERWTPGQDVTVNVADIPVRQLKSWSAAWSTT